MEVFARVVELGGFSAAARAFRMTPSAVSKLVARLETRLGTRLVNRSTRKLQLTPEGGIFYERSIRVLADLDEAERSASSSESPSGRIRLNTNASYGTHILAPVVPEFLARYPGVTLNIVQTDAIIDLMEERTDVAVRAG
ncbi:MAG: LysR family transcriptional regulator, partial [Sphingomonadaceae bacterium]